ncbi:MAG: type II toxin-antitoxin system VapC family toxin [Anaerolineae bacterium]|nr:type II toxin-antitoxin system VapC family toxin [Anaerolineae bacterium]
MSLTVVDTDILIDAARQVREAIDCLQQIEQRSALATSVITQMELFAGCRNKVELRDTERFLQRFQIIALDDQTCQVAVDLLREYRLSHSLAIPDALIAATVLTLSCEFVTKNQRDYRFIDGLQLLPYP